MRYISIFSGITITNDCKNFIGIIGNKNLKNLPLHIIQNIISKFVIKILDVP